MANMNTVRLSVPEKLAMPTNLSKSERAAEFLRQLPTIGSGVNPTTGRRLYVPQDSGYSRSRKNTRCRGCGKQIKTRSTFCRRCYQKARRHIVHLDCDNCSKQFDRPRYEVEKSLRKG